MNREQFISEPIVVDVETVSTAALARGAPACPMRFAWRGREYRVVKVLDSSRQLRAHDSSETYVKSHSFRVLTDANLEMVLRCDRRVRGNPWRVFTVRPLDGRNHGASGGGIGDASRGGSGDPGSAERGGRSQGQ